MEMIDTSKPRIKFYANVAEHFHQLTQKKTTRTFAFSISSYTIQLNIVGTELYNAITPAFKHIESKPSKNPDLTINIYDSLSSKTPFIPFPWKPEDIREQGRIRGFNDKRFHSAYAHGAKGLNLLDNQNNTGYFWVHSAKDLPYYEKGAPLRNILHWWLRTKGFLLTHAGAVSRNEQSILLAGKGGSGKSTTSISCLSSSNLKYLSDDYCLVHPNTGFVYSIYNSAKIDRTTLNRFDKLQTLFNNILPIEGEKNLYFLHQEYKQQTVAKSQVQAILVPKIKHSSKTTLVPISPIVAIRALAPSSIFQLAGTGKHEFIQLSKLIKSVPCYEFNLSTHLDENVNVIEQFLSKVNV